MIFRANSTSIKTNIKTNKSFTSKMSDMSVNNIRQDKDKKCGYLELIIGPMFSGKTTALYDIYNKYKFCNTPTLAINHSLDTRYDKDQTLLYTHDKLNIPCVSTCNLLDLLTPIFDGYDNGFVIPQYLNNTEVFLINEGQFFKDLISFVEILLKSNKKIYISGLDGDFERKKFGTVLDLIPLCDKVTKLTSFCSLCKDGTPGIFSKRITEEKDVVLVGSNNYISVCRLCYEK